MFTRIRKDIGTIMERDPAARSRWEVLTCYLGLHIIIVHRVAHACWHGGFRWLGRWSSHPDRFPTGIEIHPGTTVGRHVFIDHDMGVVIGETVEIGDDRTIYQGVTLGGTSLYKGAKRYPTLGKGVVVSAGVKVLGGFVTGDRARVGSDAVVLKPVPSGVTTVGISARIIERDAATGVQSVLRQESSAYDITPDTDDPVSLAFKRLIGHSELQQERIESIPSALDHLDVYLENFPNDPSDASELKRVLKQEKGG